jgi:hypothetical protein
MSEIWQVFKKDDDALKVICMLYNKRYVNPGLSATNIWNHLKYKHRSKYIELDRTRKGLSSSALDQGVSLSEDE